MQIRALPGQPCDLPAGNLGMCKRRGRGAWALVKLLTICTVLAGTAVGARLESKRDHIIKLVVQVQRADYEGDRAALGRLYQDLAPFVDDKELGPKVRYWRGFAQWRRAFNGFNDSVAPGELQQDLKQATSEFEEAIAKDLPSSTRRLQPDGLWAFSCFFTATTQPSRWSSMTRHVCERSYSRHCHT